MILPMEDTGKKESKGLTDRQRFWLMFALWSAFSCVIPVAYIVWRYDLFTEVSRIQFGGWGLVAVVIVAAFAYAVLKYVKRGMAKWSMAKQVIAGIMKVIVPLLALFFAIKAIQDSIDAFLQALGAVIACEAVAIPLNPLPKWAYEQSRGATEDAIEVILGKRKEDGK